MSANYNTQCSLREFANYYTRVRTHLATHPAQPIYFNTVVKEKLIVANK